MSTIATTALAAPSRRHTAGDRIRTGLRGVGQTFITLGVVILLFVVYELWWTDVVTARVQAHLYSITQSWPEPGPGVTIPKINTIPLGKGIAVLYIPRFGANYHPVIVEGTGYYQLAEGPGHYVGSAYPGQVGNFYVAGHRTTHTAPFNKLAELREGDDIYIETERAWFTYRLENIPHTNAKWQENVLPSDVSIRYPVPDQPDPSLTPTQRVLTFSTCNPEFSATHRLIVHGILISRHARADHYTPAAVVNG